MKIPDRMHHKPAPRKGTHRRALLIVTLLILSVFTLAGTARPDPMLAQADDPPPEHDPRFGAVETYHAPEIADEMGIGWTRILFYWSELEKPGRGDWNEFHAPLERIDRELAGGREVVGLVADTPEWATDDDPHVGVPRGLYLPVDDPDNLWASFIRTLVEKYEGRIHRWIIWNEPEIDLGDFGAAWKGTTADYYQLVKVAYLAAHKVDPDVEILLGGITYWHDKTWLQGFLDVASQDPTAAENDYYFEAVSLHIYFRPESTIEIVDSIRAQMALYGIDKPVWLAETNAPPYDDPAQLWVDPNPIFLITQEQQPIFLIQQTALAFALGMERIQVYKWIDIPTPPPGMEPYGLFREDGSPRPAVAAWQVILDDFANTEDALRLSTTAAQTIILDRGDETTRIFWARPASDTLMVTPALSTSARRISADGSEREIRPFLGSYTFVMDAGFCLPIDGCGLNDDVPCQILPACNLGGDPVILVENASVDLSQPQTVENRLVITSHIAYTVAIVILLLAGFVYGVIRFWRRRVRVVSDQ